MSAPTLTPCPWWCASEHTGPLPGAAYHRTTWDLPPRFTGDRAALVLSIAHELPSADDASPAPEIALQVRGSGVPLALTPGEARDLAAALTELAQVATEVLPDTCPRCGEPCQAEPNGWCLLCVIRDRDGYDHRDTP